MTIEEIDQGIKGLKFLNLKNETFKAIFEKVRDLMKTGYKCVLFPCDHKYVYRARKNEKAKNKFTSFKHVEKMWCRNPKDVLDFGRVHWPKHPVFYCSSSLKTAILEIKPDYHGLVTVMRCWKKDSRRIETVAFGFPNDARFIDGKGKIINWGEYKKVKIGLSKDQAQKNNKIDGFLNKVYRDKDKNINSYGDDKYKITAAIAKMYFDNPAKNSHKLDCICYPSVSGVKGATNYAFAKRVADTILEPDSFYVFEIWPGKEFGKFALKLIYFSMNHGINGKIKWENIIIK